MNKNKQENIEKEINLPEAIISLRKDGIVHVQYKKNTTLDVTLQEQMRDIFVKLCGENKRGFIFTAEEGFLITKEARENWKQMSSSPISAYAIVVTNLAYRLVANFFLKVYKPSTPFKLFKNFAEGLTWLHSVPNTYNNK